MLSNFCSYGIKIPEYLNMNLIPPTFENAVVFTQLLPCQYDSYIFFNISHLTK